MYTEAEYIWTNIIIKGQQPYLHFRRVRVNMSTAYFLLTLTFHYSVMYPQILMDLFEKSNCERKKLLEKYFRLEKSKENRGPVTGVVVPLVGMT